MKKLELWVHHDEDAEIYINGVATAYLEGYTTGYSACPLNNAGYAALMLRKNLIAVHCRTPTEGNTLTWALSKWRKDGRRKVKDDRRHDSTTSSAHSSYGVCLALLRPVEHGNGHHELQRDPMNWLFQGSVNGSTWTTLDTQTNQTFASRFLTQIYWITNTTAYQYYRLNVTRNYDMFTNASSPSTFGVQLSELALLAYGSAPPSAPTNLSATAGNAQVALSWNASSGATSYNMKRSTTSGGPYTFNTIANQTTTNYTDTNVVNGTIYYYVVSPVNTNGEGANSSQVSARPVSQVSTNLTFAASSGQLQLTWPQDHTGWTLQMQTNSLYTGLGTNWADVTNSTFTNQLIVPLSATNGSVFFRLKYP